MHCFILFLDNWKQFFLQIFFKIFVFFFPTNRFNEEIKICVQQTKKITARNRMDKKVFIYLK